MWTSTAARRFSLAALLPPVLMTLLTAGVSVWLEKVTGDLTRVGRWAEHDYGFRAAQADIRVLPNLDAWTGSQVLVIGDSFAQGNLWQSELARHSGRHFLTWHFDQVRCVQPWLAQLARQHPRAIAKVIFETVERAAIRRGNEALDCPRPASIGPPLPLASGMTTQERSYWPLTMDPAYVFPSALHAVQQRIHPTATLSDAAFSAPLTRADLFSSRASDRLLFLRSDIDAWQESGQAAADAATHFLRLRDTLAAQGIALQVLVVPDKSTAYRSVIQTSTLPTQRVDLAALLRQQGIDAPDLRSAFAREALRTQDFYLPNDSHLSHRGFIFLAQFLARHDLETASGAALRP
ncbi:MAG: hypothetical protein KGI67_07190 [Pseudomonadota bacterium]|nr:hypothetical protein [Pseudomonadota bacterium]